MTGDGFRRWVRSAEPGARLTYFEGNLAEACEVGDVVDRLEAQTIRAAVQEACDQGLGAAVQRRLPRGFAYEFERNRRPAPDRPRRRA